eukprot:625623-Pleurochrysis_carterae.AAC.1
MWGIQGVGGCGEGVDEKLRAGPSLGVGERRGGDGARSELERSRENEEGIERIIEVGSDQRAKMAQG